MGRRWYETRGGRGGRGAGWRRGGRKGGPQAAGPGGNCVCPDCGHKVKHVTAKPCFDIKCPKCGATMTRE